MTTYTSTNSRPCADCGLKQCPPRCGSVGLISGPIPRPYTITYADTEAPAFSVAPVDTTVPVHDPLAEYATWTGVMDAISNGPQSHDGTRAGRGRAPMWALVSVFSGLVLIGASMVGLAYIQSM